MAQLIATSKITAILGTGITGQSVARFLQDQQQPFIFLDTRLVPPGIEEVKNAFPDVSIECGDLRADTLLACDQIILSPGISLATPAVAQAINAGIEVIGDIELFVRHTKAPLVAITGSNGKSTVTTLVGEMAKTAGIRVAVGGNLGTPALDLLDDSIELYVLELSSFQLETVSKLNAKVATILNISADHMDRYSDLRAYVLAKLRVYFGAEHILVNRNDVLTHPPLAAGVKPIYFGGKADFGAFGLLQDEGVEYLAKDMTPLMPTNELAMRGRHNIENALAALALGDAVEIPVIAMIQTLKQFSGLAHRCEYVATKKGVEFYNDSKGTNVGATLAAIKGLAFNKKQDDSRQLIIILGGDGKEQDFSLLGSALAEFNCQAVLIGRDAPIVAEAIGKTAPTIFANSMLDAVEKAAHLAMEGDRVLLSPACASFDMFADYKDRGEKFCAAVKELSL